MIILHNEHYCYGLSMPQFHFDIELLREKVIWDVERVLLPKLDRYSIYCKKSLGKMKDMETIWHSLKVEQVLLKLQSNTEGLSQEEASRRLNDKGFNRLHENKGPGLIVIFFHQFLNPLIYILLAASIIKYMVGNPLDGSVILGTIFFMVLVAFIQEAKAEKAMQALKELSSPKTKVKRNGEVKIIPSEEVVYGDLLILESGDRVAADARIIGAKNLKVAEAALTGESEPVEKCTDYLAPDLPLADRANMVYAGTSVSVGKAIAVVCETGMDTEIGKIAAAIQEIHQEKTPLQKSIQSLGKWMLFAVFVVVLILASIGVYSGISLIDIFLLCVSAAVAAIPEGLPGVITIALASGVHLMSKKRAIIRRLVAVETLGSTTVICSDKTGTLTLNQMAVKKIFTFLKNFNLDKKESVNLDEEPDLIRALEIGVLCNDAVIQKDSVVGEPTEGAILKAAAGLKFHKNELQKEYVREHEIPFQSQKQYMATLESGKEMNIAMVKGSPEKILKFSSKILIQGKEELLDSGKKQKVEEAIEELGKQALRLIAVAYKPSQTPSHFDETFINHGLVFTGIFAMIDPPREESIEAVHHCKEAGIKVIMITGDNQITASAIAEKINLGNGKVLTGNEIEKMSEADLQKHTDNISIFARIEPLHKLKIVNALKKKGHTVAMTGDGVNDAPALEAADIGIAMGITGTDVAKESSEMVLADDNFATIIDAVEEGRAIFNRLRNATSFLLTTCFGELFLLIFSVLFLKIAPLIPVQILWINLITGAIVAIPLAMEPKTGLELKTPPRSSKVGLVYPGMIFRVITLSFLLGVGVFIIFFFSLQSLDLKEARTMAFSSVVLFEWLIALNKRSDEIPLYKLGFFTNKALIFSGFIAIILLLSIIYIPTFSMLFQTTPLSLTQWVLVSIPGLVVFIVESFRKIIAPKLFNLGKWRPKIMS